MAQLIDGKQISKEIKDELIDRGTEAEIRREECLPGRSSGGR